MNKITLLRDSAEQTFPSGATPTYWSAETPDGLTVEFRWRNGFATMDVYAADGSEVCPSREVECASDTLDALAAAFGIEVQ